MPSSPYVELHAASAFSFLEGASLPEGLAERAASLGYSALAVLDRDGVYGAPRFYRAARSAGLQPIFGAELTIQAAGDGLQAAGGVRPNGLPPAARGLQPAWSLPVLIESAEGYANLCRLVTRMKLRAPKGEGALALEELDGHVRGLVALAGREMLRARRHGVGGLLDRLVGIFGREQVHVELQRHGVRDEDSDTETLAALAAAYHVPLVASNGVRFATPAERPLFDVLTCIRHGTTLEAAGRRLAPNAERYLKTPAQMAALFADHPGAVAATRVLADRLTYTMADLGYRFPEYPVPPGETMTSFLRKITEVGARDRYRPYHGRARAQIARELDLIEKLDLAGYFLIVWDLVNFCRQHDILVQGRGSAANSAVCYSLGITAVDPVGMDLLFERFLSEERGEWPDIDLDLPSGDRREQVIQYVYRRYGELGAGMTANVITYRGRSAAREVGKSLGLDAGEIDRLAKAMNHFEFVDPGDTLARHLRDTGLDPADARVGLFADLWQRMQDLPRHLGQHSGGMVVCQGRLDGVVPLENASMPGRVVVQWDKDDCAEMGIVKVDLLGLGMMAVLQEAIAIVNGREDGLGPWALGSGPVTTASERQVPQPDAQSPKPASGSPRLDLAHLPPDDPAVYRLLQTADTIGLFQVESRAQMAILPRMKPDHFYDLVVQVAIIRPGPIVGQMVHPYLNRRAGRERVEYPHPSLEPILKRTLGVPLFQEQLLRMAMTAAGFTGGQAEELRRAMGFKRSEKRMRQIEIQLREGMARQGITGEQAEAIIKSITSFALYGFPESHAASFALLAYASAFLKAHYAAAFYASLLNNQPMGFYHPATLVKDAQRRGVHFAPIDVQVSDWKCTIETGGVIRLGLMYVNGLRDEVGKAVAAVHPPDPATLVKAPERCPKCGTDDRSMIEIVGRARGAGPAARGDVTRVTAFVPGAQGPAPNAHPPVECFCNICAHAWTIPLPPAVRFHSIEDLIRRTGARRDELAVLAEIGALNALGYDRRGALWQMERAVRPSGELFAGQDDEPREEAGAWGAGRPASGLDSGQEPSARSPKPGRGPEPEPDPRPNARGLEPESSPLPSMTALERMTADYAGTSLTIGPHPMTLRRRDLSLRGVQRAIDLPRGRTGQRVRTAGMVITRQRPGTAKGFVFLTLEDETGIANVIVRPDLFEAERATVVGAPFLLVEGILQNIDGVTSVKAERVEALGELPAAGSHDFY